MAYADSWRQRAHLPTDASALAAFRILFGFVSFVGCLRFLMAGWVHDFYVAPTHFFHFWFAPAVSPGPPWVMHATLIGLAFLSVCISLGFHYRASTALFLLLFGYVELVDVTNYLNHYYLVSVLGVLLIFLPLHRHASIDVLRDPGLGVDTFPRWMTWVVRFQVGLVYVFASFAKANEDWLVHGQPLETWLSARTETPLIGWILGGVTVAKAMSWGGFLFDLLIVPCLLWKRTRAVGYGVLVVFHLTVGLLFNIGMFPWIMITSATVFLAPDWARWWTRRLPGGDVEHPERRIGRLTAVSTAFLLMWGAFHVTMPLRGLVHEGPITWHEHGMRFSWRVMVREKNGSVTYRVRSERWQREREVQPSRYLTSAQEREMSGQPDLILQLAHLIASDLTEKGHENVEVRADALVAWNGRPVARLIDPEVDLVSIRDVPWERTDWVLPAPSNFPRNHGIPR